MTLKGTFQSYIITKCFCRICTMDLQYVLEWWESVLIKLWPLVHVNIHPWPSASFSALKLLCTFSSWPSPHLPPLHKSVKVQTSQFKTETIISSPCHRACPELQQTFYLFGCRCFHPPISLKWVDTTWGDAWGHVRRSSMWMCLHHKHTVQGLLQMMQLTERLQLWNTCFIEFMVSVLSVRNLPSVDSIIHFICCLRPSSNI